ncbi:hypothetical protein [Gordonia phage Tarzan]|uniref:Uncharacterized protein n=3 Tax=Santhisvirus TaxID=3152629 RepID=A0A4D6T831_9CAUD|nr:hypothetical protein QLQ75_gp36 [Gordonia phage Santhid]YP_010842635.1 hypothetical protein QLQ76_gp37 [Gordonia phage Tarzan]YP_010842699.1 hypothetical protein QLQ77_gp37 [Gordonia phage Reyja]QCG77783.1 hypothetical protein SEA_REYJA_37 [Gordonia phage Reyja]UOK18030.1 hypothetical protein SEA_SANTHID_36 [Gordonia phage Santhid]WGH20072.1 hypothetical protein [Gordonia phage Tarzan]
MTHTPADLAALRPHLEVLRAVRDQIKTLTEAKKNAEAAIKLHLEQAGADEGTLDGETVITWHAVESTRLDQRKLKEQHPDIVESFMVPSIARRLEVK